MTELEKKRQSVTEVEIKNTRALLKETKVPSPRNPRLKDEGQISDFICMRCGHNWEAPYHSNHERTCSKCKSNSIRWIRKR